MQIEIVAVVSSALIAITGVVVPSLLRRGDRRHEERMLHASNRADSRAMWWASRELICFDSLKVAVRLRKVVELLEHDGIGPKDVASAVPSDVANLTARMDTYGSLATSEQMQAVIGPLLKFVEAHLGHGAQARSPQDVLAEMRPRYQILAKTIREELAAGPPSA